MEVGNLFTRKISNFIKFDNPSQNLRETIHQKQSWIFCSRVTDKHSNRMPEPDKNKMRANWNCRRRVCQWRHMDPSLVDEWENISVHSGCHTVELPADMADRGTWKKVVKSFVSFCFLFTQWCEVFQLCNKIVCVRLFYFLITYKHFSILMGCWMALRFCTTILHSPLVFFALTGWEYETEEGHRYPGGKNILDKMNWLLV